MNAACLHTQRCRQQGFTYLGLLFLLALFAGLSALTLEIGSTAAQRKNETELLAIGEEFNRAFEHYYRTTAAGKPAWPGKLDDLVSDPRFPGTVRHLRRLYRNPLTGKAQWGTIPAPGGGIMGVFVIAEGKPLRQARHVLPTLIHTKPENPYASWRFGYDPLFVRSH
jgi:type II secretory pathway pseudopilin PulG